MKYILFLMFFITPPGPPPPPGKSKIWTLQSTSTMEFKSRAACRFVGSKITDSLEKTDTLTVRGWCFCESAAAAECPDDKGEPEALAPKGTIGAEQLKPRRTE
jgi:hypothetical protein